ncbi:thiamine-phosphate kinase [Plastoroseomonas arctica]|uniref:Thiamine-monophosphate kinase n=1 Tax=Plastoroseomonas arctica TaxID=1509237 RepID=A0AAF1KJS0_9PROT|nr:thiamine-phosphate kinase [Plastoroseomonas arctica]MBR0655064.1 thiamine-phosphate kinase [Plastoroseomonas arctica]
MTIPPEFSLIYRHFRPLAAPGALDLRDDAAVFAPPLGRELVIAADAMVAGVHFLPDDPPETVGRKLLRVNLSDLAAMGATPFGYLMTTAFPRGIDDGWIARFAEGLALDQGLFSVGLLGGDTVSTPGPMTLSLTILGHVAPGRALRRSGARVGDGVWVSGTIGDGAFGLRAIRGQVADDAGFLAGRYRLPEPRVALGQALVGVAHAAMDVSDGLVQDFGHICRESGVGGVIEAALVPLSEPTRAAAAGEHALLPFHGGDDYELIFTAPEDAAVLALGMPVTRIGRVVDAEQGVRLLDATGGAIDLPTRGWSHF